YLHEIRRHSPRTRIAVLCDYLSCIQAERTFPKNKSLQEHEIEEDRASRERELLDVADIVIGRRAIYTVMTREEARQAGIAVLPSTSEVSEEFFASQMQDILAELSAKSPKTLAQQAFSAMLVESLHADRLAEKIGDERIIGQFESYARLASQ